MLPGADSLARMLAVRLGAIVPAGFHVEADDGTLWHPAEAIPVPSPSPSSAGCDRPGASSVVGKVRGDGSTDRLLTYTQPAADLRELAK
jgi:hypothetical protein